MTITLTVTASGGAKTTLALADPVVSGGTGGVTLDARNYAGGTHAGTLADPWPASAIRDALMALPQPAGGTVMVADGIWLLTSELRINVSNFILQGNSWNAKITGASVGNLNCMWFGPGTGVSNAAITNLTFNGNMVSTSNQSMVRVTNPQNFKLTNTQFLGQPNGSIPVIFMEGGHDVLVQGNTVTAPKGGDMFQFQAGPGLGTRYTITQNKLHDSALVIIGLDECKVTNNTITNELGGGFIQLVVCGKWNTPSKNNIVDSNTVDATTVPGKENGAYLGGIPNDPGGMSPVDGFAITNNIVKGTQAYIAVQSPDNNNYLDQKLAGDVKTNVTVTGNHLTAIWSGARIDLRGGAGKVDKVTCNNNTLTSGSGPNTIIGDAHTTNANVQAGQPNGVAIQGFTPL